MVRRVGNPILALSNLGIFEGTIVNGHLNMVPLHKDGFKGL